MGRPSPTVTDTGKECLRCHELKPFEEFVKNSRGRCGRAAYCKPCMSKYVTSKSGWKEKNKANTQRWRDENREEWRARHRLSQFKRRMGKDAASDGTITPEVVRFIYRMVLCYWCGKHTSPEERTLEHITELSQGGSHSIHNVTMACRSCNSARKGRHGRRTLRDQCEDSEG